MKIGVMIESFRKEFPEALKDASALGITGVQKYFTQDYDMTDAQTKELLDMVKSNGMVFSALCGDFGCGFTDPEKNPDTIEKSKKVLYKSLQLECGIVTTHIGQVPTEENRQKEIMRSACRELALFADSIGAVFAVETGPETAVVLYDFLDSLGANGVRVNFDPANLVMCSSENAARAVGVLGKYVVHTHAKDGLLPSGKLGWFEVPLGEGDVNYDEYLPALAKTGFNGFLTIERECGDTPGADIAKAASFLREKLNKYGLNG